MFTFDNRPLMGFGAVTPQAQDALKVLATTILNSFLEGSLTDSAYEWHVNNFKTKYNIQLPPLAQAKADRQSLTGKTSVSYQDIANSAYQKYVAGQMTDAGYNSNVILAAKYKATIPPLAAAKAARAAAGTSESASAQSMVLDPATGEPVTDNTLLYVAIAAGVLVVGGGAWYYMKKKKQAAE